MEHSEIEETIHLAEYWHVLVKHKAVVISALVITVTLTMLFTFLIAPVYRATVTMVIDKEKSTSSLTGERTDFESYVSQSLTFNTHFKLITSRPVIDRVVDKLDLDRLDREKGLDTGFVNQVKAQIRENLRLLLGREEEILSPQDLRSRLVEKIQEKVDIENVRDTRLLRVRVEDVDPVLAARMANALAAAYIGFNNANRLESSQNTMAWMTDQLYEMKKKLEDAEQSFLDFKQKEKLFSIQGKQKMITQKIEEFSDAYLAARNKRLELDAKLEKLDALAASGDITAPGRSILNNPLIENLYSQLINAEVELNKLSKVYKHKHPKVLQINSLVDDTRRKLKEEFKKEQESLRMERSVLFSREKVMENTISDFEGDAMDTNRNALQYAILNRNVETYQKLYDILLAKIRESNVEDNQVASNIRIADAAAAPIDPVKPKKKLNLLLSLIVGLMTGIGLAFLIEYMDRSLRTEEDIQKYLGLPVLSVIPDAGDPKTAEDGY
ncbi:MAG: GumC family protein [Desulfobacterales bacterium]|nr:GumC family protein [Desulfobacterales bacterium]